MTEASDELEVLRQRERALTDELAARNAELDESLQLQSATSEVPRLISANPGDLITVLDGLLDEAARLSGADGVSINRVENGHATFLATSDPDTKPWIGARWPISDSIGFAEAGALNEVTAVPDARQVVLPEALQGLPPVGSLLSIPLFIGGRHFGQMTLSRSKVDPFDDHAIRVLRAFADHAAVALSNAGLFSELAESLELQTATSEVLRLISDNPGDLQAVFDGIIQMAMNLCDADTASVQRLVGDEWEFVAVGNADGHHLLGTRIPRTSRADGVTPVFIDDGRELVDDPTARSMLTVPLVSGGEHFGQLAVVRFEVRPFEERHGIILKGFAEQAAIAIENSRLFHELEQSNREVTTALEQQTAIAEVLEIISSSPTDLEPVLSQVLGIAARLCDADWGLVWHERGGRFELGASHGLPPEQVAAVREVDYSVGVDHVVQRAAAGDLLRTDFEIDDVVEQYRARALTFPAARPDFDFLSRLRPQAALLVPLTLSGSFTGVFSLFRKERRPFTNLDEGIVQTFADQAVIAIENSRLFHELEQSNREVSAALEQQTAVAAVLQTISRSAFDLDVVLAELAEQANRMVGGDYTLISMFRDDELQQVAFTGPFDPEQIDWPSTSGETEKVIEGGVPRYVTIRPDGPLAAIRGFAQVLGGLEGRSISVGVVPLMRGTDGLGAIAVNRLGDARFTESEQQLLQTFADQAVIAIENARLFRELEQSNREVSAALEQQTAVAAVLQTISRSAFDLDVVLNALADQAHRLVGGLRTVLNVYQDGVLTPAASVGARSTWRSPRDRWSSSPR